MAVLGLAAPYHRPWPAGLRSVFGAHFRDGRFGGRPDRHNRADGLCPPERPKRPFRLFCL